MRMRSGKTSIRLFMASMLSAVSAQAVDIISVNFTDGAMSATALVQGTYGVEPAANWNNILSTTSNLDNDSGVATTVDVTTVRPNGSSLWPDDYTNTVLYAGIRENLSEGTRSSVTISDLNANFPNGYKVIAYLNGASDCNAASVTDGTTTYYYKTLYTPGNFTGALTQTTDEAYDGTSPSVPVAQYAVFGSDAAPLTADSFTLTMDALLNAVASLCGFQIVGVEAAALPEGVLFYDDFEEYTDGDGKVLPTRLNPWDWPTVMSNAWNGTAARYYRNDFGCIFGSTNAAEVKAQCPPDCTGGVGAKIGYVSHGSGSWEVLTINTGIKFNASTNYQFKFRAMVKNQNNDTTNDATATGQINCIAGYYNTASSNFLSLKNENLTDLTATGWTDIDFAISGMRVTNALGNDIVVRLSRGNFTNTTDYLTWVDYIQIDEYTPVDDWLASHGLTNASWTADADGDKIDNFTEFATGGNPNDPGSIGFIGPSFIVDIGGGTNRFAYITPRQVDYWVNGVDYSLQKTTDLVAGTWGGAGTWIKGVDGQGFSAEFDAVTNFLGNIDANEKQFLRLKVSHPNYNP